MATLNVSVLDSNAVTVSLGDAAEAARQSGLAEDAADRAEAAADQLTDAVTAVEGFDLKLAKIAASKQLVIEGSNIPDMVWPLDLSLPLTTALSRLKVVAYGTGTLDVSIQRSGGGGVSEATDAVTVTASTNLDTNAFYLVGGAGQRLEANITNVNAGVTQIEVVVDQGDAA